MPIFMGEVAAFARVLSHTSILKAIQEQVRFARARFGIYDVIDFTVLCLNRPGLLAPPKRSSVWFRHAMSTGAMLFEPELDLLW